MNSNNQNNTNNPDFVFDKYVAIALIVGLVAGFIIGNSFGNKNKSDDALTYNDDATTTMTSSSTNTGTGAALGTGESVEVSDQTAGHNVMLSKINLDKTYWVAVRDNSDTVNPSYVLGAKKVFAGNYTDLSIYVSRAIESGKSYEIVFFKDGPDFDYSETNLLKDSSSAVLRSTFNVK